MSMLGCGEAGPLERGEVVLRDCHQRCALASVEFLDGQATAHVVVGQHFHALIAVGIADANRGVLLDVSRVWVHSGMLAQRSRNRSEQIATPPRASPQCTSAHRQIRADRGMSGRSVLLGVLRICEGP